jgi:aspartate racemase
MKKIGLIGGTGPESTLMYYKELNKRIDELSKGSAMPDLAIESVNFRKAWRFVEEERYDLLTDYFEEKLNLLHKGGAEIIALTAVTMHVVYEELTKRVSFPLISIPHTVRDYILSKGIKRVGLLGTAFTMEMDYMKKPLETAVIEVFIPDANERNLIAKRIFEELENGIVKEETLTEFQKIIDRMKQDNQIECIILGCTELPLLLNSDNCPVPCVDCVEIHIEKIIELAVNDYS